MRTECGYLPSLDTLHLLRVLVCRFDWYLGLCDFPEICSHVSQTESRPFLVFPFDYMDLFSDSSLGFFETFCSLYFSDLPFGILFVSCYLQVLTFLPI